jgi:hypothetical protein
VWCVGHGCCGIIFFEKRVTGAKDFNMPEASIVLVISQMYGDEEIVY